MQWQVVTLGALSCILAVSLLSTGASTELHVPQATKVASPIYAGYVAQTQRVVPTLHQAAVPSATGVQNEWILSQQESSVASGPVMVLVAAAATLGGYLLGRVSQRGTVAMAAYQSTFNTVQPRHLFQLSAAAAADVPAQVEALKKEALDKMDKALEATNGKFGSVRTGRASPALLDRIRVEYYGALTPLKQVAGVSIADSSTIVISPFDRTSITAIEKAISNSDVGLTPSNDGERIRLKVPPLTEERRKEMVKLVSKMGEEGKVAIRNVRRDILKSADKLDLSEDAEAGFKDDIQKMTDKTIKKLDDLIQAKNKDLTTV